MVGFDERHVAETQALLLGRFSAYAKRYWFGGEKQDGCVEDGTGQWLKPTSARRSNVYTTTTDCQ